MRGLEGKLKISWTTQVAGLICRSQITCRSQSLTELCPEVCRQRAQSRTKRGGLSEIFKTRKAGSHRSVPLTTPFPPPAPEGGSSGLGAVSTPPERCREIQPRALVTQRVFPKQPNRNLRPPAATTHQVPDSIPGVVRQGESQGKLP